MADHAGEKPTDLPAHVTVPLGVVVDQQTVDHPWADDRWRPVSVFAGQSGRAPWSRIMTGEGYVRYHAGDAPLHLYRSDTPAYRENLAAGQASIYVVLSPAESGSDRVSPYDVRLVTASPYEMQDYLDAGDDIVEAVVAPDSVAALIADFIAQHHVEETFKKRKRDRFRDEEHKFGQQPIFKDKARS